ncbi:uncharacterized protein LOC100370970 [Saccoglossus kowalevskii]|uniref:Disks large-associated protein 5-like n=1 Tax=Saccoglossus kowalevskii TaxID=10224 RepID=A0ABM0MIY9_SACKO|nr:PREDICTED: disks large-associated protein 5-like [Saccoglossus kowalevskii]
MTNLYCGLYYNVWMLGKTVKNVLESRETWNVRNKSLVFILSVVGNIRASIGKARLLIKERFSQFGGLIDDSEFHRGEKEVTCMDLQGFWDMIYMQVENVQDMFKDLEILQNNNWKEEEKIVVKPKPVKKVAKKAKPGLSEETKKRRAEAKEAAKKRLAEAKAKSAMLTKAKSSTPNTSVPEVVKTFEAGFFKIASPVKPPTRRVQAGTSAKTTMRLIKNVNASSPCSPVVELLRCNQMRKAKLSSTPNKQIQEKENEDFAKYLVPTMSEESSGNEPSIIDLNEQAEISMVTESTQQLEDLKIRSPRKSQKRTPVSRHFMDRNNTSNDSISTGFPGPCLGLNTPVQNGQMMNDNYLFTPMESTTNARASIDLIKFDSSDAVSDTSTFSPLEPQRQRRRSARIHSANPNPAIFSPL